MTSPTSQTPDHASAETDVRALYQRLLEGWNKQDAAAMAAQFAEDGNCIGFDGSPIDGRAAIQAAMGHIFAEHKTAAYVSQVREVRFLAPDVALIRAVVGMVTPGQSDINPATNAIQSLVAVKQTDGWRVALFQNTPAQFHGRPEAVQQLTEELRQLL